MLGDRERYAEVVTLYREILADDPENDEARRWLARVLAWQGDHDGSLQEYEVLVGREPAIASDAVERAEVLSWAGRYGEARDAFGALLSDDPGDARAARGLARVHRWAGRPHLAKRAYQRALALEEDEEARDELQALNDLLSWKLSSDGDWGADSDGFGQLWASARADRDLDHRTRVHVTTRWTRIAHNRDVAPPGLPRRAKLRGVDARIGVGRAIGEGITLRAELGGRHWDDAPDRFLGSLGGDAALPGGGVLGLLLSHGDFLDRSTSVDAVRAGLRDTTLRASHWQPLHARVSGFGWIEGSFIDDGNRRVASGLSVELAPWEEREIAFGLAANQLTFTEDSALYYDPEIDVSGTARVRASQPLAWGLAFDLSVEGGMGFARESEIEGFGATWGVTGGPTWSRDSGWWLSLRGRARRSQRATAYKSHGASFSLGRAF
jgi:hypothetical protein